MRSSAHPRRASAVSAIALGLCACTGAAFAQLPQPGPNVARPHVLTDPTPRPPDLVKEYGDDPVKQKELEQATMLRNQLRYGQVVTDADHLVLLTQQLKAQVAKTAKGPAAPNDAIQQAEAIEKLAKDVKRKMKSQ